MAGRVYRVKCWECGWCPPVFTTMRAAAMEGGWHAAVEGCRHDAVDVIGTSEPVV
jgi:hypothetical protein